MSERLQATSFRLQATSFRLQASGYKLQATSYRLQATGFRLQAKLTDKERSVCRAGFSQDDRNQQQQSSVDSASLTFNTAGLMSHSLDKKGFFLHREMCEGFYPNDQHDSC